MKRSKDNVKSRKQSEVRKGKNQQFKWHKSQMSKRDIAILVKEFNKLDKSNITFDTHILSKTNISFNENDIIKLLNKDITNLIIEYNKTYLPEDKIWDKRIVIRDNETLRTDKGKQNLCIVLSLTNNKIITAYYNLPNDKHETINMNRYCPFDFKF